ncbi:hypothetical protein F5888DRAFT_698573 [Russula emetica]|nr:hypothetical protein F5888DRAFT_698573 [Russula emetica]
MLRQYALLIAVVDKYSAGARGCLRYHPPTHISSTMFPSESSAYRSPRIPGAWPGIDATGGRSPRMSSRPYSALSQIISDAHSLPRPGILPQEYDRSEKLHLELWDPHRLAAHVMATLSPEDERAAAVYFILENKISGAFLAHYAYDIDAIFPDAIENSEIIRLIVETIPQIFWIKPACEPSTGRCNLREIVTEIRASTESNPIYTSTTKHASPSLVSDWVEQEEVEVELVPLDPIDAASDGASTSDHGRPESGAHRVWAWIRHAVCLPRSTFEDLGATFTFISGPIRGWRDGSRENVNPQTHQHSSPRARDLYSIRAGAGMGDRSNEDYLSCLWG